MTTTTRQRAAIAIATSRKLCPDPSAAQRFLFAAKSVIDAAEGALDENDREEHNAWLAALPLLTKRMVLARRVSP